MTNNHDNIMNMDPFNDVNDYKNDAEDINNGRMVNDEGSMFYIGSMRKIDDDSSMDTSINKYVDNSEVTTSIDSYNNNNLSLDNIHLGIRHPFNVATENDINHYALGDSCYNEQCSLKTIVGSIFKVYTNEVTDEINNTHFPSHINSQATMNINGTTKKVVNISSQELIDDEIEVLNKGLGFIIAPSTFPLKALSVVLRIVF